MRNALLIFLTTTLFTTAYGQVADSITVDSLEVAVAEEEILFKEDTTDLVSYYLTSNQEYVPGEDSPSLIEDRLSCLSDNIHLTYNDKIQAFVNYFTVRDREYTRMVMRRKNLYFPVFEKYLKQYDLPEELKYLSIIESGLNPKAVSRARAVGLWQFMSPTGKHFGLHQDWYIDERMDPDKSTEAACRYLKSLYGMFHDWDLALAAYNTGPGNVKKAIRRSGYKKSFWEVYKHLPRETRSYVPQFIAIIYTMNYLDEHNFFVEGEEMPILHDTIAVKKYLHFETFASLTGTCLEDLQKLNPAIQHNAIPETTKGYTLRIPMQAKMSLAFNRDYVLDSASKVGKKELELLAKNTAGSTYGRDRQIYKVRNGDVLGSIAIRHGVRVEDLRRWNNLRGNTIRVGQRLNIWNKSSSGYTASKSVQTITPVPLTGSKFYTVQPGDTLWNISRRFEGLTIDKIKSLNNLADNKIQPGQKLVLGI